MTKKTIAKTPLMEQYMAIKKKHKDAILFFRMGDFYEMFFEDAQVANKVLGIVLTSRAHGKSADVPLAGFPHHALDTYLAKMIKGGYRVAVCEQVEDPKQAKGIVKRAVVETVSPGTAFSDKLLEGKSNNYFASVVLDDSFAGLAWIDISTGEFRAAEGDLKDILNKIETVRPSEILVPRQQEEDIKKYIDSGINSFFTKYDDFNFTPEQAQDALLQHFNTTTLKGFGLHESELCLKAGGGLISYLSYIQENKLDHVKSLNIEQTGQYMVLDSSTRRNLELASSIMEGGTEGSLIQILDRTITRMGARKLRRWLFEPLLDAGHINERLDAVEELIRLAEQSDNIRSELKKICDLERTLSRVTTNRGSPRDMAGLGQSLKLLPGVIELLSKYNTSLLSDMTDKIIYPENLVNMLTEALVENPPLSIVDGGVIKPGYSPELDELRELNRSAQDKLLEIEEKEKNETNIPTLKIRFNRVFGYYIEVSKKWAEKVPDEYIRKQTLVNCERYITEELKIFEEKILNAEEKIVRIEEKLFRDLKELVTKYTADIQTTASAVASADCLLSFAEVSVKNRYCKPVINKNIPLRIVNGRHPVVEKMLSYGEQFIPNDTDISPGDNLIHIITGPNMAGKSTYIRQVGLMVLMAQIGCFVPAEEAELGLVDRIFTRVGASDNLTKGESTFLVEMHELANILNNATDRSLLLLDEIGRGTSTFDGLAIAWAATEYIHETKRLSAKTLFATHYHELTDIERILPGVRNYNVQVKEWGDEVIFLRKIVSGGASKSFGIQVAKLAGVPDPVVERSKEILSNLEANELTPGRYPKLAVHEDRDEPETPQLSLFIYEENAVQKAVEKISPDELTPKQALDKLYELKKLLKKNK